MRAGDPHAPYRTPDESPLLAKAEQQLRMAQTLFEQYREAADRLGHTSAYGMDDRLATLDQNFPAIWELLEDVARLLEGAGHDVAELYALRDELSNRLGYETEMQDPSVGRELMMSLAGGAADPVISVSVDPFDMRRTRRALDLLKSRLPHVQWEQEDDEEVAQLLAKQSRRRRAWHALYVGLGLGGAALLLKMLFG